MLHSQPSESQKFNESIHMNLPMHRSVGSHGNRIVPMFAGWRRVLAKFKRVPTGSLRLGMALRAPITDPNNPRIHLLAEGTVVLQTQVDKLISRGISEVVVSERDLAMIQAFRPQGGAKQVPPTHPYVQSISVNDQSKEIDQRVHEGDSLKLCVTDEPILDSLTKPTNEPYQEGLQQQWAGDSDERVEVLGELFAEACSGNDVRIEPLEQHCEQIIARIGEDQDALVCLAGTPYPADYPSRHAVHLANMAIAIGVQLGLDRANLIDLGIGCLVHDSGMLQIGLEEFETKTTVSTIGLKKLADHPVEAVQVASQHLGISENARMVAYQIHERLDGSGYPRGRSTNQIHDLAKIAAVADAFTGMVTPRPHRLGIRGYFAIKQILDEMSAGKFDPKVVRGLLHATSLHPIGSFVQLTNEHIGRVIRASGDKYTNPTIEMWDANKLGSTPTIINLEEEPEIQIAASIPTPRAA